MSGSYLYYRRRSVVCQTITKKYAIFARGAGKKFGRSRYAAYFVIFAFVVAYAIHAKQSDESGGKCGHEDIQYL